MTPPKQYRKGQCKVCGRIVSVRKDGKLATHKAASTTRVTRGAYCSGSYQPPKR